jgi:hypothetical protein
MNVRLLRKFRKRFTVIECNEATYRVLDHSKGVIAMYSMKQMLEMVTGICIEKLYDKQDYKEYLRKLNYLKKIGRV